MFDDSSAFFCFFWLLIPSQSLCSERQTYSSPDLVELFGSTFDGCDFTTDGSGGAVYISQSSITLMVISSQFLNWRVTQAGGAI
jgi:hypothetical protein